MSMRSPLLHSKEGRIDRAQTHSMREALDSPIRFAEPHFGPAAQMPPKRNIWIYQQGSFKESGAIFEFFTDIGERVSRKTECRSIVPTQLDSASREPSSFGKLLLSVNDPANRLAVSNTHCGHGVRARVIRVEFNSFVITTEGFLIRLPAILVHISQSAQIKVVGIEACGWFAPGTVDFGL